MTQDHQSLRLAQSQLREALEESRDQVSVHGGPRLRGVSLASDSMHGTSPAKGVTGLAEATQLVSGKVRTQTQDHQMLHTPSNIC